MNKEDIEKLLELRAAWDRHKAIPAGKKTQQDNDDFYAVFWKHGIADGDGLARFNDQMAIELLKEYRSLHGECDFCKGYDGKPPCTLDHGDKSCFAMREIARPKPDQVYASLLRGIRAAQGKEYRTDKDGSLIDDSNTYFKRTVSCILVGGKLYFGCPPGHGYYLDYTVPDKDLPYDNKESWTP